MLILSRKLGEKIVIGDNIVLTVVDVCGDRIRLGISAPKDVPIHREEIFDRIHGSHAPANQSLESAYASQCA